MPSRFRDELRARREEALKLLAGGRPVREVAEAVGVTDRTVRAWRQVSRGGKRPRAKKHTPPQQPESLETMLRSEFPAVARKLLEEAKGGDVRAAALVVKLLGNISLSEETDDGDADAARDLERELRSIPPPIASEIVGLLAEAQSAAAGASGSARQGTSGRGRRSGRLPWQTQDSPPDEGEDQI